MYIHSMNKSLFLLCCLLSFSCAGYCGQKGPEEDGVMCNERIVGEWSVSSAFSSEHIEELIKASDDWNVKTDGKVSITWKIVDTGADVFPVDEIPGYQANIRALADGEKKIKVLSNIRLGLMRSIISHELGHKFGLAHKESGIMRPNVDDNYFVTDDDLNAFNTLWKYRK